MSNSEWNNYVESIFIKDYCMNCDGDKKIAFIHIPRTSGKSIRKSFNLGYHFKNFKRQNYYACSHRRAVDVWDSNIINNFDTFTVIRDPWSRLLSLYQYYSQRPDMKQPYESLKKYKNFSEFVYDYSNLIVANSRNDNIDEYDLPDNFRSCSYWVCDNQNQLLVKNIIRFDTLNKDLNTFANKVGMNIKFPLERMIYKANENIKKQNYNDVYMNDKKLIDKVADIYKIDINKFGFEYK